MISIGARERIATPLYVFCVTAALWYPNSSKTAAGNSEPLSSCSSSISTFVLSSHFRTCSVRARIEFTFQLAISILNPLAYRDSSNREADQTLPPLARLNELNTRNRVLISTGSYRQHSGITSARRVTQ